MGTTLIWANELDVGGSLETSLGDTVNGTAITSAALAGDGIYRTGLRPVFVNFRGDIYVGGIFSRPLVRHMSSAKWLPAGIKPPDQAVSVVPGAGAGGSSGDCIAYITFLHKVGNRVLVESNPSNFVDVGTLSGQGRVWSNIQSTGAERRVTHVRGYVSMNGADYRMAWEAPYGVTGVTENVSTTRLSLLGPNAFNNDIPPIGVKYIHPWAGRMWYASNNEFPYRLWYSRPGYPQYVGKAFFLDMPERETITGMWRGRNELVVFALDNSYMVRQFGSGEQDFVIERLDSNVGCLTHHGIQEVHNRIWFPARDGVWIYDGAFRYVMDDLRLKWERDYCLDPASFENGFAQYDKLHKVYMFFQIPTIDTGASPTEWEPKTGISPRTVIWTGYIGEFEPSMGGQELQPDWSWDFRGREDSSAFYSKSNDLFVGSCDGEIRRQIKPCELEPALAAYRADPGGFDPDDYGGEDDSDSVQKKLIIRHPHMLFGLGGDDVRSGKELEQAWSHTESEISSWTFYVLGGDEDAWNQIRPDNTPAGGMWKRSWGPSDKSGEAKTIRGVDYLFTYCAQSVHFMLPEKSVGRGFTFEIQATSPVLMKYRGVGGMWSPGIAHRPPSARTTV